jgi:hypothetical protein
MIAFRIVAANRLEKRIHLRNLDPDRNSFARTQLGQTPDAEKGIHELLTAQRSFLDNSA